MNGPTGGHRFTRATAELLPGLNPRTAIGSSVTIEGRKYQITGYDKSTDQYLLSPTVEEPSQVHDLKCWPPYWDQINQGRKTFEIRRDDRGFRVGDLLVLREWIPDEWLEKDVPGEFTGRVCYRVVTSVLIGGKFGLAEGYVALSLAI